MPSPPPGQTPGASHRAFGGTESAQTSLIHASGATDELRNAARWLVPGAAQLYLSVYTVEAHLSRVCAKLGIRSRTQLARRLGAPV
jgi:hypothetical protein